jgi:hypothetical protein
LGGEAEFVPEGLYGVVGWGCPAPSGFGEEDSASWGGQVELGLGDAHLPVGDRGADHVVELRGERGQLVLHGGQRVVPVLVLPVALDEDVDVIDGEDVGVVNSPAGRCRGGAWWSW